MEDKRCGAKCDQIEAGKNSLCEKLNTEPTVGDKIIKELKDNYCEMDSDLNIFGKSVLGNEKTGGSNE